MQCFVVNSSELSKRLDCFYYLPEFVALEKKIQKISDKNLGDFIESIAGGATPNRSKESEYYSDKESGFPFLRVQNITEKGLNFANIKYITNKIHNGMLNRSKIHRFDLITKITGVGKMAISSVAPDNFEGNINQHLVVMKTKDKITSETLAAYLNSDVGEKLALRRSTGGTRPALDYDAIKSIPIIYKPKITKIIKNRDKKNTLLELEINKIQTSLQNIIVKKLGIKIPKPKNNIYDIILSNNIQSDRLDPRFYQRHYVEFDKILKERNDVETIDNISMHINSGSTPLSRSSAYTDKKEGIPFIRITDIKNGKIELSSVLYIKPEIHNNMLKRTNLKPQDVLLSIAGTIGISTVVPKSLGEANINQALVRLELKKEKIRPDYLSWVLNSPIGKIQTDRFARPSVQANLKEVKALKIPVPDILIQDVLLKEIKTQTNIISRLRKQQNTLVNNTKKSINRVLLN